MEKGYKKMKEKGRGQDKKRGNRRKEREVYSNESVGKSKIQKN